MSFDKRHADTVLRKLGADVKNSHHKMGLVAISPTYRIRLYRSHGSGSQPAFIEHKWRQQLRLRHDEFAALVACDLDGTDAIKIIRHRLGL